MLSSCSVGKTSLEFNDSSRLARPPKRKTEIEKDRRRGGEKGREKGREEAVGGRGMRKGRHVEW